MVAEDFLGQRLVRGDYESPRIAARERGAHELKIADHVLIVDRVPTKPVQQIEYDGRLPVRERLAKGRNLLGEPELSGFVTEAF